MKVTESAVPGACLWRVLRDGFRPAHVQQAAGVCAGASRLAGVNAESGVCCTGYSGGGDVG
jgi:hypothetical protein